MALNTLNALSPLDGRYRSKIESLARFFSESALIQYRIQVEIEYFILLHQTEIQPLKQLSEASISFLRGLYENFSETDAQAIKEIERTTNHDVKAVEYFIKQKIEASGNQELVTGLEFVHFGLTSQDINNTAQPMMLQAAIEQAYLPLAYEVLDIIHHFAVDWDTIPMLARTHGQAASPTTLGKEFDVFAARLESMLEEIEQFPFPAKFGGATGNMNAHFVAYPEQNWQTFATHFVEQILQLKRSYPTTQIDHYDGLSRIFDGIRRVNTILTDLSQDCWIYISMDYFGQKVKAGEVGSSAMPHKVNPIDFENAEGNFGLSTALLEFLSRKLPISRLQRDLTDSTVMRNMGVAIGHSYLALTSLKKGLGKLLVNQQKIAADLDANWAVLAEAIQTILRREGYPKPYEALKALTRGKGKITQATLLEFIETLDVTDEIKTELRALRPETYIGRS